MRLAAADDRGIGLAGPADVVGIAAIAADELGIFAAPYRLADAEFSQRKSSFGGSVIHCGKMGSEGGISKSGFQIKPPGLCHKNSFHHGGLRDAQPLLHFSRS